MVSLILLLLVAQPDEDSFGGGLEEFDRGVIAREEGDREKAALRRRLAEDRVRTQFLRREEASIFGAIQRLDRALSQQRRRGAELVRARQALEHRAAQVDRELAVNAERLRELRDEIGRRAASMLRLKRTPLADLLARAKSPIELRRLRDRLRIVLAFDAALVKQTTEAAAEARRLSAELNEQRRQLDLATAALAAEEEQVSELRAERGALLEAIQRERRMIERIAGEIAAAAKKLDLEVGTIHGAKPPPAAAPGGLAAQRGRLPWPASGRLEVAFGKRVDPETGMVMDHKGIDIRADLASPVRAVWEGKVVHRGWLEGYGRVLILEHPDGWYSIYAHLESFGAAAGQQVGGGQVVGFVGDSGSMKGAYLYFELRQGKRAVDPQAWLAR
jgi:septal ring factor EnvC (AmiA/AmiB activator)